MGWICKEKVLTLAHIHDRIPEKATLPSGDTEPTDTLLEKESKDFRTADWLNLKLRLH